LQERNIGVVALGPTNEVLLGEYKWGSVSDRDLAKLRSRAALPVPELPSSHQPGAITYACFSARGEWGDGVAREIEAGPVLGFSGKDLLRR
jgi:hypothetical protein